MKTTVIALVLFLHATSLAQPSARHPGQAPLFPANSSISKAMDSAGQLQQYRQGFDFTIWLSNAGTMGRYAWLDNPPDGVGCRYPAASTSEHIFGAGPWIGAIVDTSRMGTPRLIRAVSTGYEGWSGPLQEMFGNRDGRDSFFITSRLHRDGRNMWRVDDDNDGRVDEDDLDAIDNDGDGRVDEDFAAISDNDVYVAYYDTNGNPGQILNHTPLGIKVWQKTYAWEDYLKVPILPMEFKIVNVGRYVLDSVFIGLGVDPLIGYWGWPIGDNTVTELVPNLRSIIASNPKDTLSTPLGVTYLGGSKSLDDSMNISIFEQYTLESGDRYRYQAMSVPGVRMNGRGGMLIFSIGPWGRLRPGDTLSAVFAFVSGDVVELEANNLLDNLRAARALYRRGYSHPIPPPSPRVVMKNEGTMVTLDWSMKPSDPWPNPLDSWDESDLFLESLPDTHWRRRNPPGGVSFGGRCFEGFRLYRCEGPRLDKNRFSLLAQYDVNDDLGIGYQTGLRFTYIDSGLSPTLTYWYAVTSYSLPGLDIQTVSLPSGEVRHDTLVALGEAESDILANATGAMIKPEYRIFPAYPNPFNPSTVITFELQQRSRAAIRIYDLLGREVAVLADGLYPPGRFDLNWDASGMAAGIYFCRLDAPSFSSTTKLVLLK